MENCCHGDMKRHGFEAGIVAAEVGRWAALGDEKSGRTKIKVVLAARMPVAVWLVTSVTSIRCTFGFAGRRNEEKSARGAEPAQLEMERHRLRPPRRS